MKISVKRIPKTTNWVEGTAGKYGFQTLVFEENSCYGNINKGSMDVYDEEDDENE